MSSDAIIGSEKAIESSIKLTMEQRLSSYSVLHKEIEWMKFKEDVFVFGKLVHQQETMSY